MVKKFIEMYSGIRITNYNIIKLDNEYYIITEYESGQSSPNTLIKYENNNLYNIFYKEEEEIIAIRKK